MQTVPDERGRDCWIMMERDGLGGLPRAILLFTQDSSGSLFVHASWSLPSDLFQSTSMPDMKDVMKWMRFVRSAEEDFYLWLKSPFIIGDEYSGSCSYTDGVLRTWNNKIIGKETVATPTGEYDCFVIEETWRETKRSAHEDWDQGNTCTSWYSPEDGLVKRVSDTPHGRVIQEMLSCSWAEGTNEERGR